MSQNDGVPPRDFLPALRSPKVVHSPFFDYIRFSEFKRLLGQIAAIVEQDKIKTLSVLSTYPQEGKTFFVCAMALGYAVLLNKRVLIVNTALKLQGDSLNIRNIYEEQLQNALVYGVRTNQATRMIDLMSPQLDENEDSVADTVDFQIGNYINTFKHNYELILIDTCPLTVSGKRIIDPIVIAGQADASILMTSPRSMNRDSIKTTKELFSQWRVRILGTIHNARILK